MSTFSSKDAAVWGHERAPEPRAHRDQNLEPMRLGWHAVDPRQALGGQGRDAERGGLYIVEKGYVRAPHGLAQRFAANRPRQVRCRTDAAHDRACHTKTG